MQIWPVYLSRYAFLITNVLMLMKLRRWWKTCLLWAVSRGITIYNSIFSSSGILISFSGFGTGSKLKILYAKIFLWVHDILRTTDFLFLLRKLNSCTFFCITTVGYTSTFMYITVFVVSIYTKKMEDIFVKKSWNSTKK